MKKKIVCFLALLSAVATLVSACGGQQGPSFSSSSGDGSVEHSSSLENSSADNSADSSVNNSTEDSSANSPTDSSVNNSTEDSSANSPTDSSGDEGGDSGETQKINVNPVGTSKVGLSYKYVTKMLFSEFACTSNNVYVKFYEDNEELNMGYDNASNSQNETVLANFAKQLQFNGTYNFAKYCRFIPQAKTDNGNIQIQKLDKSAFAIGDTITFPQGAVYEYDKNGDGVIDSGWYFTDTYSMVYNTANCANVGLCVGKDRKSNCGDNGWHICQDAQDVTYTVFSLGHHYSLDYSTQLTFSFQGKNTTIDLGYTGWTAPDDNTAAFLQYFKLNGANMCNAWNGADTGVRLQGLDQKDGLCLTGISLKVGDVISIQEGAVFTSPTGVTMRIPYTMYMKYTGSGYKFLQSDPGTKCEAVFFSDIHHNNPPHETGAWNTIGINKLNKILEETKDTNFYVDFGDFVQHLVGGVPDLYKEAYDFMDDTIVDGQRHYHVMGNHEAAYIDKRLLNEWIPYTEGVGSAYVFEENNMLFVGVDACFDANTGLDTNLGSTTSFTIPQAQIDYLSALVNQKMHADIQGIVWVSHVAFTNINDMRWELVSELAKHGKPISVFDGHTHIDNSYRLVNGNLSVSAYTLTSANVDFEASSNVQRLQYSYYRVSFKDGYVEKVQRIDGMLTEDEADEILVESQIRA